MTFCARPFTTVCRSTVGIATRRPNTVVIKALEIPPAIALGSPAPKIVIAWKVMIIPVTVPKRPMSGATAAMIFRSVKPDSSFGVSRRTASAIFSSSVSVSMFGFSWLTNSTRPSGLFAFASLDLSWLLTAAPVMVSMITRTIANKNAKMPTAVMA